MMRDMVYDFPNKVAVSGGGDTQRALAAVSDDGKQAAVLIGDLYGSCMDIPVEIKGFGFASTVTCTILDDARENVVVECKPDKNGLYHLKKSEPGSAAFMLILKK